MLSKDIKSAYKNILFEELRPAMGCTEPIAISYASAILREALGCEPKSVRAGLSGNIIKNVKSVIVPATGGKHGIEAAIAAGIISARPDKRLEVLTVLGQDAGEKIDELLSRVLVTVCELKTECTFELDLYGEDGKGNNVTVRIIGAHTNVTEVTRNGEALTSEYRDVCSNTSSGGFTDRAVLNVADIVEFAESEPLDVLKPLLMKQVEMNMTIAEEGLKNDYGASIGKLLLAMGNETPRKARAYAAAGSDARMSGCELPVTIISGSGNQGITSSVPVVVYARDMGCSEELMLRALIVSDLVTIHQKTGIGCLSAYCGAISAGVGAGAGICFLHGGRFREIAHTLVNAVAILSGTICDGAKPSCAAKIAMAVEAGIMGFEMYRCGKQFLGGDGIITKGVENTIKNVGRLARDGMSGTDREIIRIMLGNA